MLPEDRLKQAEILLETSARYINRHEEAIARQGEAIARQEEAIARQGEAMARYEAALARQAEINAVLDRRMLEVVDLFSELAAIVRESDVRYRENQQEIRRIWEYLLSQGGNGHSSQ